MVTTSEATDGLAQKAASAPFAIAPERADDLAAQVFGETPVEMRRSDLASFFAAVVEDRHLYVSPSGLAGIWCLAHAAFHVSHVGSWLVSHPELRDAETVDVGLLWSELRLGDYVAYARRLMVEDEPWPDGLDTPDVEAPLTTDAGLVTNLALGAVSWVMLHELGHITKNHGKLFGRDLMVRQEWEADNFATGWALAKAVGEEREFRALAIVVALAWLFVFEEAKGGGDDHPSAILRFREATSHFALGDDSVALERSVYLLKAIFDPTGAMPGGMPPVAAFDWMTDRLEELFPRH
ncbi:phage exclusion protein Lit family protein [Brevundimonas naejangsanensis]